MGLLGRSIGKFPRRRGFSADEWAWSGMPPRSRTAPGAMAGDTVLHASLAAGTVRPAIRPAGHPGLRILLLVHCVRSFPHVRAEPPCVSASGARFPPEAPHSAEHVHDVLGVYLAGVKKASRNRQQSGMGQGGTRTGCVRSTPTGTLSLFSHWAVPEVGGGRSTSAGLKHSPW